VFDNAEPNLSNAVGYIFRIPQSDFFSINIEDKRHYFNNVLLMFIGLFAHCKKTISVFGRLCLGHPMKPTNRHVEENYGCSCFTQTTIQFSSVMTRMTSFWRFIKAVDMWKYFARSTRRMCVSKLKVSSKGLWRR